MNIETLGEESSEAPILRALRSKIDEQSQPKKYSKHAQDTPIQIDGREPKSEVTQPQRAAGETVRKPRRHRTGIAESPELQAQRLGVQKQIDEGRTIRKYSVLDKKANEVAARDFFQHGIKEYYPNQVTPQQLGLLDTILSEQPAYNQPSTTQGSCSLAFQLSQGDIVKAATIGAKCGEEIVSVLFRGPTKSGLLFFNLVTEQPQSEGLPAPMQVQNLDQGTQPSKCQPLLEYSRCVCLTAEDSLELEKRSVFRTHFVHSAPSTSADQRNELEDELRFLLAFLGFKRDQCFHGLAQLKKKITVVEPVPSFTEIDEIHSQLQLLSLRKNIAKGMKDVPLDTLNHFKLKASQEEHRPYHPNRNLADLADFISRKQIRKNKKTKFPLTTSCLGCLSDFQEESNLIESCYDCGVRAHRLCSDIENNSECSVCQAKRCKKVRIQECVLCSVRGLIFRKCGDFNVHVYCLLVFGYYRVKDLKIQVLVQDIQVSPNSQPCMCCGQHSGRLVKCSSCERYGHPACCYLAGFLMSVDELGLPVFDCEYYPPDELQRNRFNRLYRGNFHKYAYRFLSFEDYARRMKKIEASRSKMESSSGKDSSKLLPELEEEQEPTTVVYQP